MNATGLIIVLFSLLSAAPRAQQAPPAGVAGTWRLTMETAMGKASPEITLRQDGDTLSGSYTGRYGTFALTGRVKGRVFEFSFLMHDEHPVSICFQGEVSADGQSLEGSAVLAEMGDATWTATKDDPPAK